MRFARAVLISDPNARSAEQLSGSWGGAAALAVVDNSVPPFAGLDVAVRLKRATANGQVVVVSSSPSVAMAVRAMRLGLDSFLAKPTSAVEILASIQGETGPDPPRPLTLDEAIWEHISQTIVSSGSVAEAARRLGVERRSLRRMVANAPKG